MAKPLLKLYWYSIEPYLTDRSIVEKIAREKKLSPNAKAWLLWAQRRLYDALYHFTWET